MFWAVGDFVPPCVPGVGLGDRGSSVQTGPDGVSEDGNTHCCLVAIGRLQVTSTPNTSDLTGSNSNNGNIKIHINNLIIHFNKIIIVKNYIRSFV